MEREYTFKEVVNKTSEMFISLGSNSIGKCVGVDCNRCPLNNEGPTCNASLMYSDPDRFADIVMNFEIPVDWSKVTVDTPILVKDHLRNDWIPAYFAKFKDNKVYAFGYGTTSWTNYFYKNDPTPWNYAKLFKPENDEKM